MQRLPAAHALLATIVLSMHLYVLSVLQEKQTLTGSLQHHVQCVLVARMPALPPWSAIRVSQGRLILMERQRHHARAASLDFTLQQPTRRA